MAASKIFFSYSRIDSGFALQLAKDIRSSGIDIWIDQLDIQAGNHWDAAVEKALSTSACVLVILTPSSTSSTNVMDEVSYALESGKKIIPVLLEDCLPPFRLRRLQRIDFTKDYNAGLTQLLAAIEVPVAESAGRSESEVIREAAPPVAPDPAKKAREEAEHESRLWDTACKLNSVASYEKYLKDSVTGEYTAEAKLLIHQLTLEQQEDERETSVWKKTKADNTLQGYRDYLKAYPDRNYKTLAMAAIAEFEAAQKEEQKRQEERRKEEQRQAELKKEAERAEAKRQAEKREAEKREEARLLEEKRKEEKRIEEQKKLEKRKEEERQEALRKEQKKQEAAQKEKEKEEKKKLAAEKAAAAGPSDETSTNNSKKILVFGSAAAVLGLLIWLIVGMNGAGKRDEKAWLDARQQNISSSYEAYVAQFPKGKFAKDAQVKIDSIRSRNQVVQDSLAAVAVATEQAAKDNEAAVKNNKTVPPPTTAKPTTDKPTTDKPTTDKSTTAKPPVKPTPTTPPPTKPNSQYKIGYVFGGGTILYIDNTGQHGLVVAEKDLGNFSYETAVKKKSKFAIGPYNDWRIPTKDELAKIYGRKTEIGINAKGTYWSSTPDKNNSYWAINMIDGKMAIVAKDLSFNVRLVRNF
jgi:hypothetical protein